MLYKLLDSFKKHADDTAFCIAEKKYTYKECAYYINTIQHEIKKHNLYNQNIAVITSNNLQSYAAIFAIWFSGNCFVPINPSHPIERNKTIIEKADIALIINTTTLPSSTLCENSPALNTHSLPISRQHSISIDKYNLQNNSYILFTSGSTGIPKGVAITFKNVDAFCDAFFSYGFSFSSSDRFLQMFDFNFDVSVLSYLVPVLSGSSIYTVSGKKNKHLEILHVLQKHHITFAAMVPSLISLIKPFINRISLPELKHSLFAGETLYENHVEIWKQIAGNCTIHNGYGPTENTILTTVFSLNEDNSDCHNKSIPIGKALPYNVIYIDKKIDCEAASTVKGELCISSPQLTKGYLKNETKNQECFFYKNIDGTEKCFYRTGDIVTMDENNLMTFVCRKDDQVQVQGFRVELGEIEANAKLLTNATQAVAVTTTLSDNTHEIHLFLEKESLKERFLQDLSKILPHYMIPKQVHYLDTFPLSTNGKIDKKELQKIASTNKEAA